VTKPRTTIESMPETSVPLETAPKVPAPAPDSASMPETTTSASESAVPAADKLSIAKPGSFSLNKFKSTVAPTIASVQTLLTALACHKLADANDFARLHPNEETHWSDELCFVNVPIVGQKRDTLHLISEDLALRFLESKRIQRFRLALATKPHDVFFLCHVPSRNLDNKFNETNLLGCQQAKTSWVQLTSRKGEGVDEYKISYARDQDAFPAPSWPTQSLEELILVTYTGRMIDTPENPALLRLIGAKQAIS
jgi:hypothetical protein